MELTYGRLTPLMPLMAVLGTDMGWHGHKYVMEHLWNCPLIVGACGIKPGLTGSLIERLS
jgi:hypothetical protein